MDRFICGLFYNTSLQFFVVAKRCTMDYENCRRFREYAHAGDVALSQEEYNKLCYQLFQGRLQHKITDDGK